MLIFQNRGTGSLAWVEPLWYIAVMAERHTHTHDHRACVAGALAAAETLCARQGARLTPLREQVLTALWSSHKAQGAYDLLALLNKKAGKKLAPLSVYRALDFLVAEGLAHRIESLNAYIGCPHPAEHCESGASGQSLLFLVCQECRLVTELDQAEVSRSLAATAKAQGFKPSRAVVEVIGLCRDCAPG